MRDMMIDRRIDELGRVVLPIDIRRALNMEPGDTVSVILDRNGERVVLKKRKSSCCGCQSTDGLKTLPNGKHICGSCLALLSNETRA